MKPKSDARGALARLHDFIHHETTAGLILVVAAALAIAVYNIGSLPPALAFALGALSLAGARVPAALKVFLLTLAVLDDLGSIVIIALFYTVKLSVLSLALAGLALAVLIVLNRLKFSRTAPYVIIGIVVWVCVLKSGIHATLAGVALAMTIPLQRKNGQPFIHALEEGLLHMKFLILPLFAFANAGPSFGGFSLSNLAAILPLGIGLGLMIGKPLGILLAVGAAVLAGFARLPENCRWRHMAGAGCLAGIGFTVSLFIGSLAFEPELQEQVRVGVIVGSLVSTLLGVAILLTIPASRDSASAPRHPAANSSPRNRKT